jgi:hypothetical protein
MPAEPEKPNRCKQCGKALIEIDHYGERLIGCIDCTNFGKAASSGMTTHRIAALTSLCPLSGSFSSRLSVTQAMVPATSTV